MWAQGRNRSAPTGRRDQVRSPKRRKEKYLQHPKQVHQNPQYPTIPHGTTRSAIKCLWSPLPSEWRLRTRTTPMVVRYDKVRYGMVRSRTILFGTLRFFKIRYDKGTIFFKTYLIWTTNSHHQTKKKYIYYQQYSLQSAKKKGLLKEKSLNKSYLES